MKKHMWNLPDHGDRLFLSEIGGLMLHFCFVEWLTMLTRIIFSQEVNNFTHGGDDRGDGLVTVERIKSPITN
jgi:hypothetical protein